MSGKIVLAGATSGTITLQAPDVAGNTVITLPATSGNLTLGSAGGGIESVASRPGSPTAGTVIWNTSSNVLETWNGVRWVTLASQNIVGAEVLIVAGGGGGAGGYRSSVTGESSGGGNSAEATLTLTPATSRWVVL